MLMENMRHATGWSNGIGYCRCYIQHDEGKKLPEEGIASIHNLS